MSYKIYTNFLQEEDFKIIQNESIKIYKNPTTLYMTNFTFWQPALVEGSNVVLSYNLSPDTTTFQVINSYFKSTFNKSPTNMMFYFWSPGSYITWHEDSHCDFASTLYLNDEWDKNWGGYYMANQNDKITAIKPERNQLIFQSNGIEHCTTATHKNSPLRATLQIFSRK